MRLGVAAAIVDGVLVRGDVDVDVGLVSAVGLREGTSGIAIPGLVDLQVNGYAGVDVLGAEPGELGVMGAALARDGVLAYQPTLITAGPDRLRDALGTIGHAIGLGGGARIIGAHLEGPFLSPQRAGAHPLHHLRDPNLDLMASFLLSGCPVTTVTIAPELDTADEVIEELRRQEILVSIGHTDATAVQSHAGFDLGARSVTHLFNAMRPFGHRDPGCIGAALSRSDVTVMLIADGVHVAPEALLTAWRAARGRTVLVSDAMAATGLGLGDGVFSLGDLTVTVENGVSRLPDGVLAGAVRPLAWGLRYLIELGVPIVEAVEAATRAPARLVGRPELSRLAPGAPADLVVLDDEFAVERVLIGGTDLS